MNSSVEIRYQIKAIIRIFFANLTQSISQFQVSILLTALTVFFFKDIHHYVHSYDIFTALMKLSIKSWRTEKLFF